MTKQFYSDAGKGSHARVRDVDAETYASNWDKIFGKKEVKEKPFCNNCGNTGKTFDGGWLYDCRQCTNTGCNTAGETVPVGD